MSRYENGGRDIDGGIFKKYPWLKNKPDNDSILSFKVTPQMAGYPRRVAQQVYGNHNLHWVITAFNYKWYGDLRASDGFNWPRPGQVIYYPSRLIINPTL
jgi:hypothetical protein